MRFRLALLVPVAVLLAIAGVPLGAQDDDRSRVYTNLDLDSPPPDDVRVYTNTDLERFEPYPTNSDYVDPFEGLGWEFVYDSLRFENEKRQAQRDADLTLAAIEARARAEQRRTDYYPGYWPLRYGYPWIPRAERPRPKPPVGERPAPERHWRFRPPNLPPVRNHFPPNRTPAPTPRPQR